MEEKFWSKSTWLTTLVAVVYTIVAIGAGALISH